MSIEQGNTSVSDLTTELGKGPTFARVALVKDGGGWVLRYIEAVIGARPPGWRENRWIYNDSAFVAAELTANQLSSAFSGTDSGRIDVGEYTAEVPKVGEQINWERRPSRTAYDALPLPWPTVDYRIYRSNSDHIYRMSGFLVGDDCPSFPGFETAFRAFFYADFSTIGAGQVPNDLGRLRLAQLEAWLRRVRVSPTHLEVWISGEAAVGARLELNAAQVQVAKKVGKSRKVRIPLPEGLPDDGWLYLSRDKAWLDYRVLGSRLARPDDLLRAGVEIETPRDPETEIGLLISGGEGPRAEFKAALPADTTESKRKVLKTIAAFASEDGGSVVFGMDPDESTPIGIGDDLARARDRVTDLIRRYVRPSPEFDFRSYEVSGKPLLVLDVIPGPRPPYGLGFQDSPLEFYVRRGANTYPATAEEVRAVVVTSIPDQAAHPQLPGRR